MYNCENKKYKENENSYKRYRRDASHKSTGAQKKVNSFFSLSSLYLSMYSNYAVASISIPNNIHDCWLHVACVRARDIPGAIFFVYNRVR